MLFGPKPPNLLYRMTSSVHMPERIEALHAVSTVTGTRPDDERLSILIGKSETD